jgi:integrase
MSDESKKKRARRGGGSLFEKPKGNGRWHVQYYRYDPNTERSERIREYCGLPKQEAQRLLNDRLAKVGRGEQFALKPVMVAHLYDALLTFTKNEHADKPRSVAGLGWRWKHLAPFFAPVRAANVTTALIEKYRSSRSGEGAAKATINHEVGTLRRMYHYGKQSTPPTVHTMPHFPMFKLNNARQGFVEPIQFERLRIGFEKEGLWMRLLLELAYTYGWRRGELLNLRVRQVDLADYTLRLDPGTTKNRKGREVAFDAALFELLRSACDGKEPEDYVITRDDGKPVKDFRGAWQNLCVRAGLGDYRCRKCAALWIGKRCECGSRIRRYKGPIVHDMRRSAARELRKAGVHENVIMAIGGWKTRSMFDRYAIVNNNDTRLAMEALAKARIESSPRSAPAAKISDAIPTLKGAQIIQ